MKHLWLLVFVFLLAPSAAAVDKGSQSINLNVGAGIPLTDLDLSGAGGGKDRVGTAGFSVGGQYVYHPARRFGLGLDINYSRSGEKHSSKFTPLLDATIRSESLVALLIGKFLFRPEGKASPYLIAGGGIHHSRLVFNGAPAAGLVWLDTGTRESRNFGDDTASNYAAMGGLGVDVAVTENAFIGLEGRYQHLGDATYSTNSLGRASGLPSVKGEASMVNVFGRVGYRF